MLRFLTLMKYNNPTLRFCNYSCDVHYFYTRNLFVAMFILSITKQLFGDTIVCCCSQYVNLHDYVCLTNGTFTKINEPFYGSHPILPRYYHYYYQWIPLVFLLESLAFSIPNFAWETAVGKYIKQLSITSTKLDENYCEYIVTELKKSKFCFYFKHLVLDLVYFGNVLLQMYLLDMLLNNDYIDYMNLFEFKLPSNLLFPLDAYCEMNWKESSDWSFYKMRCVLPLNVLYKKSFLVLWFWLHFLCFFQPLVILVRMFEFMFTCCNVNTWALYQIVKHNINGENYRYIRSHFET